MLLLPEAVDDYVSADNPVPFIDAFVNGPDLATAGFGRVQPKVTGRPAANTLGPAEGQETGHAATLRYGMPVWSSLGTQRMPLIVPAIVRRVVVFADPEKPGLVAA
jgi:hypothetical protein